jgi:cyclase
MAKKPLRIIPRLDIKGPNLVKGIKLEGLRVLGNPELFAEKYYQDSADEFFFQDIVASLYERNNLSHIVELVAKKVFVPLTVGGGIRSLHDIETVLRSGADKVSINTAAIKTKSLISDASQTFGSSTICIAVECIKINNEWVASYDNGREVSPQKVAPWIQELQDLGAGEIIITNVDREGTSKGVDRDLLELVTHNISIPLIYHGGINTINDIKYCYDAGCDGVAIASILHYNICKSLISNKSSEGNYKFIDDNLEIPSLVQIDTISQIKSKLSDAGVQTR